MPASLPLNPDRQPMGATVLADGSGVVFRVWAPRALDVWVVGNFNSWTISDGCLLTNRNGFWVGFFPGLTSGTRYKFRVRGQLPSIGWKRDPYARELTKQPPHPASECVVDDPRTYPWHDGGYAPPYFHDLVIYQLHVGTFHGADRANRPCKFLDVLGRLDYLVALGVNALLLLPIVEFMSQRSLGYEGADIFSPEQDYCVDELEAGNYVSFVNRLRGRVGLPPIDAKFLSRHGNQFKVLVELCHLRGIAVLLDVVYNHVNKDIPGPQGVESIWNFEQFDMHHDHESYLFSDQDHNGPCWDIDWKEFCRQFLIDNAVYFLNEYHIDGFRYDEVSALVANSPLRGWEFCQTLTNTVRYQKPRAVQIAEYWRPGPDPWVVGTEYGHAGFDACYHDGLRYAIRDAIRASAYGMSSQVDMGRIAQFLWPAGFDEVWRCVQHIENHDIVYLDEGDRIPELAAPGQTRSWFARSRSRVASGLLMLSPGIPMIFMGQEFLEDKRFHDDPQYHAGNLIYWDGLDTGSDRAMVDFHRYMEELIRFRLTQPALRGNRLRVLLSRNDIRVLIFQRWLEGEGRDVIVAASLNDNTIELSDVPWPGDGDWREVFNSDAYDTYQPGGNRGRIHANNVSRDGLPATARLTIPANSILAFTR